MPSLLYSMIKKIVLLCLAKIMCLYKAQKPRFLSTALPPEMFCFKVSLCLFMYLKPSPLIDRQFIYCCCLELFISDMLSYFYSLPILCSNNFPFLWLIIHMLKKFQSFSLRGFFLHSFPLLSVTSLPQQTYLCLLPMENDAQIQLTLICVSLLDLSLLP